MLYKERDYSKLSTDAKHSNIKSLTLLGDVNGKDVIIADDMIATGGTLITAMKELKKKGAKTITSIEEPFNTSCSSFVIFYILLIKSVEDAVKQS